MARLVKLELFLPKVDLDETTTIETRSRSVVYVMTRRWLKEENQAVV